MHIFFYDGTENGFFSALFDGYSRSDAYLSDVPVQLTLTDESFYVTTSEEKATRVKKKLHAISPYALHNIKTALRSSLPDKAQRCFLYVKRLILHGKVVDEWLHDEVVLNFFALLKKISGEVDKLKGLLRFCRCNGGILYAPFEPDNDILDLLLPHFSARLPQEKFVIHDVKRKKALLYAERKAVFVPLENIDIRFDENNDDIEALWQRYYHSVNIPSRKNTKQMKGSMPVRYWKYLPEKRPYSPSSNEREEQG